jgi:hypothetical protein
MTQPNRRRENDELFNEMLEILESSARVQRITNEALVKTTDTFSNTSNDLGRYRQLLSDERGKERETLASIGVIIKESTAAAARQEERHREDMKEMMQELKLVNKNISDSILATSKSNARADAQASAIVNLCTEMKAFHVDKADLLNRVTVIETKFSERWKGLGLLWAVIIALAGAVIGKYIK